MRREWPRGALGGAQELRPEEPCHLGRRRDPGGEPDRLLPETGSPGCTPFPDLCSLPGSPTNLTPRRRIGRISAGNRTRQRLPPAPTFTKGCRRSTRVLGERLAETGARRAALSSEGRPRPRLGFVRTARLPSGSRPWPLQEKGPLGHCLCPGDAAADPRARGDARGQARMAQVTSTAWLEEAVLPVRETTRRWRPPGAVPAGFGRTELGRLGHLRANLRIRIYFASGGTGPSTPRAGGQAEKEWRPCSGQTARPSD